MMYSYGIRYDVFLRRKIWENINYERYENILIMKDMRIYYGVKMRIY